MGAVGRLWTLQAAGWQEDRGHRMVGLCEWRCRADQGDVIIDKRKVQIRAHRPLWDRTRLIATLPAASLDQWYRARAGNDEQLFAALRRLDLDQLPQLPGVAFVHVDKLGRIVAAVDGSEP